MARRTPGERAMTDRELLELAAKAAGFAMFVGGFIFAAALVMEVLQ